MWILAQWDFRRTGRNYCRTNNTSIRFREFIIIKMTMAGESKRTKTPAIAEEKLSNCKNERMSISY